tara:strand:+ start:83 stop:196 length:114 start_codon:yes stop_codon:yes gene_type:complete
MYLMNMREINSLSKLDANAFAQGFAVEKRGFYDEVCE